MAKTQAVRSKQAPVVSLARAGTPATGAESAAFPPAPPAPFEPSALSQNLSEFEFSMFTLMFGFQAWTETCMAAADIRGLNSMDILVLHAVNHRARARRQTEICMVLNIEDQHLVTYALKKLMAAELVVSVAEGRERFFETTAKGDEACIAYRRVREEFLVPNLSWIAGSENAINDTSGFLRTMTALYAQAGRLSYSIYILHAPLVLVSAGAYKAIWHADPADMRPYSGIAFAAISLVVAALAVRLFDEPVRGRLGKALAARSAKPVRPATALVVPK